MAYVAVPKDLTKIKNKVAFNLTKRQLICFTASAALGIPFYFLTRGTLGNTNAGAGMVLFMVPGFLLAMYEKDGMPFEKILMNILRVRFFRPKIRCYVTENIYEVAAAPSSNMRSQGEKPAKKKGAGKRIVHRK